MSFWIEMLYAVRQIHQNGIVHCDLKPSNFVMNDEGNLKLIDFGISCSIQNDMTSAVKSVCEGSLNYIGPEALNSQTSCNPESPSFGKPQFKVSIFLRFLNHLQISIVGTISKRKIITSFYYFLYVIFIIFYEFLSSTEKKKTCIAILSSSFHISHLFSTSNKLTTPMISNS